MVHNQVEAHVVQVDLLHLRVKLGPLQHLKRVAVDVEHFVRLDLGVAALHDRLLALVVGALAVLFLVQPVDFALPLLLDDLDHVALVFRLENWQSDLDRPILVGLLGRRRHAARVQLARSRFCRFAVSCGLVLSHVGRRDPLKSLCLHKGRHLTGCGLWVCG